MITSVQNPRVKYVRRLQAEKRFRQRENSFVVEGTRWLKELVRQGRPLQFVFIPKHGYKMAIMTLFYNKLTLSAQAVSPELMALMSDTETPPGVLAVAAVAPLALPPQLSLLLILDAVTNPGNLGTMLRTAPLLRALMA
ncbi:MAG: hypothetical protein M5U34_14875 [Chloroflexi bacterium]|nr:hypothetical protein [Chloroflexota bacterium]